MQLLLRTQDLHGKSTRETGENGDGLKQRHKKEQLEYPQNRIIECANRCEQKGENRNSRSEMMKQRDTREKRSIN